MDGDRVTPSEPYSLSYPHSSSYSDLFSLSYPYSLSSSSSFLSVEPTSFPDLNSYPLLSSFSNFAPTTTWIRKGRKFIRNTYDVILSFQAKDTPRSFVDHLYAALDHAGISTFKDDKTHHSRELLKTIKESRVAVVIFSKRYANCFCHLIELEYIIRCRGLTRIIVLPVFYDVNPSEVRNQTGHFQAAFQHHEMNSKDNIRRVKKLMSFRKALMTTSYLSGWDLSKTDSGSKSECIEQIVRYILNYLRIRPCPVEDLNKLDSDVLHIKSLPGDIMSNFSIENMSNFSIENMSNFSIENMSNFSIENMSNFSTEDKWNFLTEDMWNFSTENVRKTAIDDGLATSSNSSSTAAPTGRWTYDVFISFRGEDTRKNFVDHLYAALDQAGIYTFKDDKKLQRGKSISPELVKAIQESMVAVVVFSKNYANSSWCLDELVKIIKCRDLTGQIVLPVFYDVDPSDVRGQTGSFYAAFQQHDMKLIDDMAKVKSWKEALAAAASLSGWDVSRTVSGHEAECIKQIVRNILSYTETYPAENLIGMESRVRYVKSLLSKRSGDDFCIIGIWGMGGIGKTTIARAVYHQISNQFEGSSFLEDVRENGSDKKGLKSLQEKLLSEILMENDFKVKDCHDGICQTRRRLSRKKVLVVLDDVDNIKQLEFLAGGREWFGPGSRILVTTRDQHLLSYAQEKYTPELLEEIEAMKLFSRYAFNADIPPKAYEKLSRDVVTHTGHLPLALKILGSHFCGRNLDFWESGLKVLAKIPHEEINGNLKLSYDGLNILEKKIFLHIACFFKGKEKGYVTRILDSLGFEAVSGITVLIEKSILTISKGNLHMHDLVQEMGCSIIRECYPNSLVWVQEEIKEVMMPVNKLEIVEAIVDTEHDDDMGPPMTFCSTEAFKSMKKLKLLQVRGEFTLSEPEYFPEQLRWLCWSLYPFESLRISGGMANLVGLEMPFGRMKLLHIEEKVILTNIKFMDLRNSQLITIFPDVSGVPNLEDLNLSHCSCLVEVHQSVGLHGRIINIDLSYCYSLEILPSSMQMKSLQSLNLNHCKSLERFPEFSGDMGRLCTLGINGCDKIRALPSSIRLLTGLSTFMMGKCSSEDDLEEELEQGYSKRILPNNLRIQSSVHLSSLRLLDLRHNYLVESDFPRDLHNAWPSLENLDISRNLITRLPITFSRLSYLGYLDLRYCINLKELLELPLLIQVLRADHCRSLEKIGDLSNKYKWLFQVSLHCCPKLVNDRESKSHLTNLSSNTLVQKCAAVNHRLSVSVPGNKIPNWFSNQRSGNMIRLKLRQNQVTNSNMIGLAICCLFSPPWTETGAYLKIKFKVAGDEKLIGQRYAGKGADRVWIGYMSTEFLQNLFQSFESDLVIILESSIHYPLQCGVEVIYKDDLTQMKGNGPWIPDYNELQHERWPLPTFSFDQDHNTANVML